MNGYRVSLGWLVAGLASLAFAPTASAQLPCAYYAAPLESEGGRVPSGAPYGRRGAVGTPDAPIAVSDFWKRDLAVPGAVLCLQDGLYRGKHSMLVPSGAVDGAPAARIEVRAVNDGEVWIDGEFQRATLRVTNSYWSMSGLNAYNSVGPPVGVRGKQQQDDVDRAPLRHVTLRRIVAWRDFLPYGTVEDYEAIGGHNIHIFDISQADDVLVEDCAGFGWARKIFQNYTSKRVTFRRNWARWDGRNPYRRGNKFSFSCSYKGYDALCENLIATVGGSRDRASAPESYDPSLHLIATDGAGWATDRWLEPPGRDVHALGLRIRSSLAYTPPESEFQRAAGFHIGGTGYPNKGQKGVHIENSVAVVRGQKGYAFALQDCKDDEKKHPDGCSWNQKADRNAAPLIVEQVTGVSPRKRRVRIGSDWRQNKVVTRAPGEPIDIYLGTDGGGALCYRSVDGRDTSEPLWPWPMQERIARATERSNWETADVMGQISRLFGPPPPECTR